MIFPFSDLEIKSQKNYDEIYFSNPLEKDMYDRWSADIVSIIELQVGLNEQKRVAKTDFHLDVLALEGETKEEAFERIEQALNRQVEKIFGKRDIFVTKRNYKVEKCELVRGNL